MMKGQPCSSHWQGLTALLPSLQSWGSQVMLVTTQRGTSCCPEGSRVSPVPFHLSLCFSTPGREAENIPAAKLPQKVRGHSRGAELAARRNPVCLSSRDRVEFPGVSQGSVATQATGVPSISSGVTCLVLQPPYSHHRPWFASTNWPLSVNLI